MINFPVPTNLGIGMSRGAATRLTSEEKILDYAGRPLNLASRLMDLARPKGLVFDGSFGLDLLPENIASGFESEQVYVRSLAEKEPITVHYSKNDVILSPASKQPIEATRWQVNQQDLKFKDLKAATPGTPKRYELDPKPSDPNSVQVRIEHPIYNKSGRKISDVSTPVRQFFFHELVS